MVTIYTNLPPEDSLTNPGSGSGPGSGLQEIRVDQVSKPWPISNAFNSPRKQIDKQAETSF
jgi:hypothetical protein